MSSRRIKCGDGESEKERRAVQRGRWLELFVFCLLLFYSCRLPCRSPSLFDDNVEVSELGRNNELLE